MFILDFTKMSKAKDFKNIRKENMDHKGKILEKITLDNNINIHFYVNLVTKTSRAVKHILFLSLSLYIYRYIYMYIYIERETERKYFSQINASITDTVLWRDVI